MLDEIKQNTKLTEQFAVKSEKRLETIRSAVRARLPRLEKLVEDELAVIATDMMELDAIFNKSSSLTQWIYAATDLPNYSVLTEEATDQLLLSLHNTFRASSVAETVMAILVDLRKFKE